MKVRIAEFVASRWSVPIDTLDVAVRPLRGGLESSVMLARVSAGRRYPSMPRQLVVKELRGDLRREAAIYDLLWQHIGEPPAARPLGVQSSSEAAYLYLENVRRGSSWPWSDSAVSAEVCRALARLHDSGALESPVFDWNYEHELARSAIETLALVDEDARRGPARLWRRRGDLRRVVAALPSLRAQLLRGATVIHGDVHPGNVMVRRGKPGQKVVLLDWGRARIGSPLEDVASWLQSLGCWEPEARRRHDTLLRIYLENRRIPARLTRDLRRQYWFGAASNGLAGAVRYHMYVLTDPQSSPRMRSNSAMALDGWQRVIRRAALLLGASSAD